LYNLAEVRFFLNELKLDDEIFIISDDVWGNAKRKLIDKYKLSSKFEICNNLIKDFEGTNTKKKYKSDFEVFIRESRLEDFISTTEKQFLFQPFTKQKAKSLTMFFLMLENFDASEDEKKRQLYVAMTRAKQRLTIHLNGNYLDKFKTEELEKTENNNTFQPPSGLAMHLSHKDLYLGYFVYIQKRVNALTSGDKLFISDEGCKNENGELVLKFSKKFLERLEEIKKSGFELKEAKVNFIVYWTDDNKKIEVKVVLPELHFERANSDGQIN
jgi:ATP-dependent DNA helicase RecQ